MTARKPSYRDSHLHKGADYDSIFRDQRDLAILWEVEQRVLRQATALVTSRLGHKPHQLDFASGSGRVLASCIPYVESSTAVDVSESMLAVARGKVPTAEFINADLTRDDVLGARKFGLITAFRFFPNAEQDLRAEVVRILRLHMEQQGLLIANNHLHQESMFERLRALLGRQSGNLVRSDEFERIFTDSGFMLVQAWGVGYLPLGHRSARPKRLVASLEWNLTRLGCLRSLARYQIYAFESVD